MNDRNQDRNWFQKLLKAPWGLEMKERKRRLGDLFQWFKDKPVKIFVKSKCPGKKVAVKRCANELPEGFKIGATVYKRPK